MGFKYKTILTFLSQLVQVVCHSYGRQNGLVVETTSGKLHGFINSTSPRVRQFLGIPYAQPPVDSLRFKRAIKYTNSGQIDAKNWASNCMQDTGGIGALLLGSWNMSAFLIPNGTISEDCLYLNVFAPSTPVESTLPVFVWIHGGAFASGGSYVPYQIPDQWVERSQAHIVVTINYRLNIFGFPNAAAGTENFGLLDQRLAVEWVRDNIAGFGGDTSRIVLWGQSAGASSVNYYALAYPQDPIVYALVSDSGSDSVTSDDPTHGNFSAVAEKVGCGGLNAKDEYDCTLGVSATDLTDAVANLSTANFAPQADNVTVFSNFTDRILQGGIAKLPWIVGNNKDESVAPISGVSLIFICETEKSVRPRLAAGITIYRYDYAGNFSNITPLPDLGAAHSTELPLIFGTHWQYHHNSTEFEFQVSWAMQDLWLSFAQNSSTNPTTGQYTWPHYERIDDGLAAFALNDSVVQDISHNLALGSIEC